MKRFFPVTLLGAMLLAGAVPTARADQVWQASSIIGDLGAPAYGLRLDGFFDNHANSHVTFALTGVTFTESGNAAHLNGLVTVNRGDPAGHDPRYNLNVTFARVTDTSHIHMPNPNFRYYTITHPAGGGPELTSLTDPRRDFATLGTFPTDGTMPFQVGVGANNKNNHFGAAGWLNWNHHWNGQVLSSDYAGHGDFLMDLNPVPEPSTLALAFSGLAGIGFAARHRFPRRSVIAT